LHEEAFYHNPAATGQIRRFLQPGVLTKLYFRVKPFQFDPGALR
jgi:hypothetical protein